MKLDDKQKDIFATISFSLFHKCKIRYTRVIIFEEAISFYLIEFMKIVVVVFNYFSFNCFISFCLLTSEQHLSSVHNISTVVPKKCSRSANGGVRQRSQLSRRIIEMESEQDKRATSSHLLIDLNQSGNELGPTRVRWSLMRSSR